MSTARSPKICGAALALALVGGAGFIYYLTRGTTFWLDEWQWIAYRRGDGVGTFLNAYNGHLSLVPIALYHLLFALFGLRHYAPYRLMVIGGHIGCVLLVYLYARTRVGDLLALLAALLILFLGPGWEDFLWPFQIAWLVAIGAGILAFLLLDRHDPRSDIGACVLTIVSLASTSLGVAVALGLAVDVALVRRRWRDGWIVAVPLGLYALWALVYSPGELVPNFAFVVAPYAASAAAGGVSSLLGLAGSNPISPAGTAMTFGVALSLVLLMVAIRAIGGRRFSARAASLATVLMAFWVLTALGRAFSGALVSRYLYVDGVFILLLAIELAGGVRLGVRATVVLAGVAAAVIITNIGILRGFAGYLRSEATVTRADLTALDLTRPLQGPHYIALAQPGYPVLLLPSADYFAAARALGNPADSVASLATVPAAAQDAADVELVHAVQIKLEAAGGTAVGSHPPRVEAASDGAVSQRGACDTLRPAPASATGAAASVTVTAAAPGLRIKATGAAAIVSGRRFAPSPQPLGSVTAGQSGNVVIVGDASPAPWHVQISSEDQVTVCGLKS